MRVWRRNRKKTLEASKDAVEKANRVLNDIQSRSEEVSIVSKSLRQLRETNHFGEQLENIMYGRPLK